MYWNTPIRLSAINAAILLLVLFPLLSTTERVEAANSGSFKGQATKKGCRSDSRPLNFYGSVSGGIIKLQAAGTAMTGKIDGAGKFSLTGRLRKHKLGTKMQWWKGQISNNLVTVRVTFGVPGHTDTYCTARGTAELR